MKKTISILFSIICVVALIGCSGNSSPNTLTPAPQESVSEPSASNEEVDVQTEKEPSVPVLSSEEAFLVPIEEETLQTFTESETEEQLQEDDVIPTVNIQAGGVNFTAVLYDNESARTIIQEMPFTLQMDDFSSQEKVTDLSFALPPAQTQAPSTINSGDLYLWSGNNLVLFYTTFSNSYSYVPIGYITDVTGLTDALGSGSVEVTFSVNE